MPALFVPLTSGTLEPITLELVIPVTARSNVGKDALRISVTVIPVAITSLLLSVLLTSLKISDAVAFMSLRRLYWNFKHNNPSMVGSVGTNKKVRLDMRKHYASTI